MRRRDFAVGFLAGAATQSVWAQERAKQRRIAVVIPAASVTSVSAAGARAWQAFFEELRRAGDIEGQNLTIERYSGEGRPAGYADLAREVVDRKPDVIAATNDAIAKAARAATGTIPIVWIGGDPVQAGLAMSLAHPGGNITGVIVYAGDEIWGKRLQILKEVVPAASKAAYLTTRVSQAAEGQQLLEAGQRLQISVVELPLEILKEVLPAARRVGVLNDHTVVLLARLQARKYAARALGIELQSVDVNGPADFVAAFKSLSAGGAEVVDIPITSMMATFRDQLGALASASKLPAVCGLPEAAGAGCLAGYGTSTHELFGILADLTDKMLKGGSPADTPARQPTKFELVINLKTAKALGLTIPPSILARADEVIE